MLCEFQAGPQFKFRSDGWQQELAELLALRTIRDCHRSIRKSYRRGKLTEQY
eukprot:TRINITY_DN8711_c0_g1_i1.p1 TRINITY_DN8711_c0_g1~~TRINITY_DN8711_c0_g1_i1.p1  ORF type:complete len:52 (+),score=3.44 TRINITY_DN8711_c0_g1_i1:358-513(+)